MTILSWLFGAPGWLLAGGLILVAVFGLGAEHQQMAVGSLHRRRGRVGRCRLRQGRATKTTTHEAGDKLLQAEQALRTAGGRRCTAAREIEARDRMLRQIEADAAGRTRNAGPPAAPLQRRSPPAPARRRHADPYVPQGDTPAARPKTPPRSGSRRGASDASRSP